MARAIDALGYDSSKIEVVIYQFVTLVRSGRPVKMSTRKANFVTLDDLINEVGEDVTRFFFLMRSPASHLEFDLDQAKDTSEKNPVFYLQYAHARVCSIFRRAAEENITFADEADLSLLQHPSRNCAHQRADPPARGHSLYGADQRAADAGHLFE